jgi:hypothetical protein
VSPTRRNHWRGRSRPTTRIATEIHQDVKAGEKKAAPEPAQFWAATQVTVKSWADCDDDDDYYATTALPPPVVSDDHPSELADTAPKEGLSQ